MATIDKLRGLHKEVCGAWRKQSEPSISEGKADVLNLGFLVLETLVIRSERHWLNPEEANKEVIRCVARYIRRVKSQFDDNDDMAVTGDLPSV